MADSLQDLNCPCCNKKMVKVFDNKNNIYIDICVDGCGGIFFDNREYQKYDEKCEDMEIIINTLKNKVYEKVDDSTPRTCPVCGSIMVKHASSTSGKIKIDECYGCGAVFLDNSELEQIRAEFESEKERAEDFEKRFEDIHKKTMEEIENRHKQIKPNKSFIRKVIRFVVEKFI